MKGLRLALISFIRLHRSNEINISSWVFFFHHRFENKFLFFSFFTFWSFNCNKSNQWKSFFQTNYIWNNGRFLCSWFKEPCPFKWYQITISIPHFRRKREVLCCFSNFVTEQRFKLTSPLYYRKISKIENRICRLTAYML